jgi:MoxR-like ATPase
MKDTINKVLDVLRAKCHPHWAGHSNWPGIRNSLILSEAKAAGLPTGMVYKIFITDFTKTATRGHWALKRLTPEVIDKILTELEASGGKTSTPKAPRGPAPGASFTPLAPIDASRMQMSLPQPAADASGVKVTSVGSSEMSYVPAVNSTYVKWGDFDNVARIIASGRFFPLFISGMSGNGKTLMVEQACALTKREFIRVQITPETDEDDLIGGFRLIGGETVFAKGPVVIAAERGAVLLIDEIDRGSNKIMCLQGVLEGKPFLLKKTGEVIPPRPGFTVVATANTTGRGSEDGRYNAAQIIDDAFLERFVAAIEQPFAPIAVERNIVKRHMELYGVEDDDFADKLVAWSTTIRKTFESDGVEEVISTRRLCHIVSSYSIFQDRRTSIEMCISRFDSDTRQAFIELYAKLDADIDKAKAPIVPPPPPERIATIESIGGSPVSKNLTVLASTVATAMSVQKPRTNHDADALTTAAVNAIQNFGHMSAQEKFEKINDLVHQHKIIYHQDHNNTITTYED